MQTEYRQHSFKSPAGALDLLLVRHGESDPALHANGAAQAIAVGARLRAEPLMALYVKTRLRPPQTAAPLATHLGLTLVVKTDLREAYLGN